MARKRGGNQSDQQNIFLHHRINLVHIPPSQPSLRCLELTHIEPVPKRMRILSGPSPKPSSRSDLRVALGIGNRGSGRLVMNDGKSSTRSRYSGFGKSGDVHIRKYSSSSLESSNRRLARDDDASSAKAEVAGLGKSSIASAFIAESNAEPVDWDDDDATERESTGVSRKGSLGARPRFGLTTAVIGTGSKLDGSG